MNLALAFAVFSEQHGGYSRLLLVCRTGITTIDVRMFGSYEHGTAASGADSAVQVGYERSVIPPLADALDAWAVLAVKVVFLNE